MGAQVADDARADEAARALSASADAARAYAVQLTSELAEACGGELVAAYLHGSAALGGWVPELSDIDLLFVMARAGAGAASADVALARAGEVLLGSAARCPGSGLECSLVTAAAAGHPAPPWPFLLHVAAGPGGQELIDGRGRAGDEDLLMHYAVCRSAGVRLHGPPPPDCIGPVGRPVVLAYLAAELGWGLDHAPECYSVLNACRALAFLSGERIVSKVAGGLEAIERGIAPAGLVQRALDQQQDRAPRRTPGPEATAFVLDVAAALRAASQARGGGTPTA
jgi:Domain of unknown function (DUF4111)